MNSVNLRDLSIDQLVQRFATLGIRQNNVIREGAYGKNAEYNRLATEMKNVEQELKVRSGDKRDALFALYNHPNMQVRLMAAKLTLAISPDAARQMLQRIQQCGRQPQAGDAGMCLWNLDRGVFVPK
ncbi:MAG TPA: DUF2019 domain-containing protein [Roseiarcus sp.]|nr:DUF2019 domain-containing protein [Roseiarcus sp.]